MLPNNCLSGGKMAEPGELVTFSEAAKVAAVHINTIRNWRKAGRLKTAQLVIENGSEVWFVELAEVLAVAGQGASQRPLRSDNNNVNDNVTQAGSQALANLYNQQAELQRALTDANEARRKDAGLIGELSGELKTVNQRIDGLQEQLRASQGRESVLTRLIIGLVAALVILAVIVAIVAVIIR